MTPPILTVSNRTKRTPYTPRLEALGVKSYTIYNHTLLATVFRTLAEDYLHLRQQVQVWDVTCQRQIEVSGPDAARLVQLITPRDISKAKLGQCLYAPLVDDSGGMINDPVILKLAEDRFWISIADSDVFLWLSGLACGLGLEVAIAQPDVWPLAVQGPKADDLMAALFGEALRALRFFRFTTVNFRGHDLIVARAGYSKQGGFEILVDEPSLCLALWDALFEAGRPFDVGPGCPNLIERIEGGLLSYGNDMTRANNPLECGLERYCALEQPVPYLGRDALRQDRQGRRRALGARPEDRRRQPCPPAWRPWPVSAGGARIGAVTSAAISPSFALRRRPCHAGARPLDGGRASHGGNPGGAPFGDG